MRKTVSRAGNVIILATWTGNNSVVDRIERMMS